jgi:hypothetical protein
MSGGICSNCHEELYILEYQGDYIDSPLSDEFMEKAQEQQVIVSNKLKIKDYE